MPILIEVVNFHNSTDIVDLMRDYNKHIQFKLIEEEKTKRKRKRVQMLLICDLETTDEDFFRKVADVIFTNFFIKPVLNHKLVLLLFVKEEFYIYITEERKKYPKYQEHVCIFRPIPKNDEEFSLCIADVISYNQRLISSTHHKEDERVFREMYKTPAELIKLISSNPSAYGVDTIDQMIVKPSLEKKAHQVFCATSDKPIGLTLTEIEKTQIIIDECKSKKFTSGYPSTVESSYCDSKRSMGIDVKHEAVSFLYNSKNAHIQHRASMLVDMLHHEETSDHIESIAHKIIELLKECAN
jgi:hypothetical protein